jgi:dolichol kinase
LDDTPEQKDITYNEEVMRKAVHVFSVIIPLFYFILPRSTMLIVLSSVAAGAIFMDISRMSGMAIWSKLLIKPFGSMIRPKEREGFTGASYIISTDVLVILLFAKPVAICAMAFIALGDSAAAVVGRRWGFHKYGKKSLEGSLGFFLAAAGAGVAFHFLYPGQLPLIVSISGAFVATIVEAMSVRSDDNMTVPTISGLFMQIFIAFL